MPATLRRARSSAMTERPLTRSRITVSSDRIAAKRILDHQLRPAPAAVDELRKRRASERTYLACLPSDTSRKRERCPRSRTAASRSRGRWPLGRVRGPARRTSPIEPATASDHGASAHPRGCHLRNRALPAGRGLDSYDCARYIVLAMYAPSNEWAGHLRDRPQHRRQPERSGSRRASMGKLVDEAWPRKHHLRRCDPNGADFHRRESGSARLDRHISVPSRHRRHDRAHRHLADQRYSHCSPGGVDTGDPA